MTHKSDEIPSWATHTGMIQPWNTMTWQPLGPPTEVFLKATPKRYYRGRPADGAVWWPREVTDPNYEPDNKVWMRKHFHPCLDLTTVKEIQRK